MKGYCELPPGLAQDTVPDPAQDIPAAEDSGTAVLAGGCFWCTEAVFERLEGVDDVTSGYTGGSADTARYRLVCGGDTGHAEAILIRYRPDVISYGQLLKIFFTVAHDPTQKDRQGNDVGSQYRSAIFYADERQRAVAAAYIKQLNGSGLFRRPLATTLEPLQDFHEAEPEHQDFAVRNPAQPYIAHVSQPKVDKLEEHFPDRVKG